MDSLKISGLSIALMVFVALFSVALPLVTYFILRKKIKARFVPVLIGAATFIVAALILERIVHSVVLGNAGVYAYLMKNPIIFGLYGGLMAGLFEESGRFGAFKLMRKKYNTSADALSYGIGHGGIEAIILLGFTMVNNIVLSIMVDSGSINSIAAALPAAQFQQIQASVTALAAAQPAEFLEGAVERVGAMTFHVGLSVLVYLAASRRASFWFYPLAILLHAMMDFPAVLVQVGILKSVWLMEAFVLVFAGLVLWFAISRLKSADRKLAAATETADSDTL